MEEAQNPKNITPNPTLERHACTHSNGNQTMSVGAVTYPSSRGRSFRCADRVMDKL